MCYATKTQNIYSHHLDFGSINLRLLIKCLLDKIFISVEKNIKSIFETEVGIFLHINYLIFWQPYDH